MKSCPDCGCGDFDVTVEMRSSGGPAEIQDDVVMIPAWLVDSPDFVEVGITCQACGRVQLLANSEWDYG